MPADPTRARYERLQAAMARRGVGTLLLATPHLAAFASGARRVQTAGSGGTLPWVVVAAGAPSAVVFTTDPDGAPPWMPRDAVEPLRWNRTAQLDRLVALVLPGEGAIAIDVLSPVLREVLGATGRLLVDAAPLLVEAAAGRSEEEVEAVRRAVVAARAGLAAALAGAVPGATLAALVARFARTLGAAGVGFPLTEGLAWSADRRLARRAPEDPLEHGEAVVLELGCQLGGYAGVAGDTTGADVELGPLRRQWRDAVESLAVHCRPGVTTADLRAAAAAEGLGQIGLLAHGLGVGLEPPYCALDAEDVEPLLEGTVLVLAPVVAVGGRAFRATRALVVGDGLPRWLEPSP